MGKHKTKGKLIVITAPSGAGKSTIVKHLLKHFNTLDFSISATTRAKRDHEVDGVDYHFLSCEEFQNRISNSDFVEWEEVYPGMLYGTLKTEMDRIWLAGNHIIFDIDVNGACNLKEKYKEKCLSIFIKPPSIQILVDRLKKRKTETPASLAKRVRRIKRELSYETYFDRIILNDLLDVAFKEAELVVNSFIGSSKNTASNHGNGNNPGN